MLRVKYSLQMMKSLRDVDETVDLINSETKLYSVITVASKQSTPQHC